MWQKMLQVGSGGGGESLTMQIEQYTITPDTGSKTLTIDLKDKFADYDKFTVDNLFYEFVKMKVAHSSTDYERTLSKSYANGILTITASSGFFSVSSNADIVNVIAVY